MDADVPGALVVKALHVSRKRLIRNINFQLPKPCSLVVRWLEKGPCSLPEFTSTAGSRASLSHIYRDKYRRKHRHGRRRPYRVSTRQSTSRGKEDPPLKFVVSLPSRFKICFGFFTGRQSVPQTWDDQVTAYSSNEESAATQNATEGVGRTTTARGLEERGLGGVQGA